MSNETEQYVIICDACLDSYDDNGKDTCKYCGSDELQFIPVDEWEVRRTGGLDRDVW